MTAVFTDLPILDHPVDPAPDGTASGMIPETPQQRMLSPPDAYRIFLITAGGKSQFIIDRTVRKCR